MSERPTAAGAAHRVGSGTSRLVRAWKVLPDESRLAGFASIGLFLTLFLPWYQVTLIAPAKTKTLQSASASITGWGAFSFVEAAVLLVAAGVLVLLFQRAEGRAFHLPGGDGGVITAAGLWTCLLIVWRIFDKQGATTNGPSATTSGIEWGIFFALGAAAFLAYAGSRIRAAHRPEPPLPGEDSAPVGSSAAATTVAGEAAPRRPARADDRTRRPARAEDRARRPAPADDRPRGSAPAEDRPRRSAPADDAPRRRPRPPRPGPGDRPARTDRAARADRPARADRLARENRASPADSPHEPPPARPPEAAPTPRRRASASELFERVVPDDPPQVPFGRAKPADADATLRMKSGPPRRQRPDASPDPDEQLTIPLAGDDDTLRLDRD